MSSSSSIIAVFEQTAQGLLAARVDDLAWLAIPVPVGLRIASAWRLSKPIADWDPTDFYSSDGIVADEAAFSAHIGNAAQHRRELAELSRPEIGEHIWTPWGSSQQSYRYADGVTCHSTAGHGGFHLAGDRNLEVHDLLRNPDGWYEEDCEWAKVAFTLPELFTIHEQRCAARTLRHDYPDAWEHIHGVTLAPGESRVKDERAFRGAHASDWVVIAALRSDDHPGFVECFAKLGGNRSRRDERRYLVPVGEYQAGQFGFVIDESRHQRCEIKTP